MDGSAMQEIVDTIKIGLKLLGFRAATANLGTIRLGGQI
jgi:hypothetical protein